VETLRDTFQEWADWREARKTPEERAIPIPPNLPVPELYLEHRFLAHKNWTYTEYEAQPDDFVWRERTIYDLQVEFGLL
jgi:hypothetical protein